MSLDTPPASGFKLRPSAERGHFDMGWTKAAFSFSFAHYFDRNHMHFENLRVINEDLIDAGQGIGMHPHDNVEIFSYILEGALEHKDSMGNGSTVSAGGIQYMSAGTGVLHSEFNPSKRKHVKLLQIWLLPNVRDPKPRYETMDIPPEEKDGKLKLFLSHDGRDGSMHIRSNASIYNANLNGDQQISYDLPQGHKAWIQVAKGGLTVNGQVLEQGDGLSVSESGRLNFTHGQQAEFILFDLFGR